MKIINKILNIINPDPFASHNCSQEPDYFGMVKKKSPLHVRLYHRLLDAQKYTQEYFRDTARYWYNKAYDIHEFLQYNEETLKTISPVSYYFIRRKEQLFLSLEDFFMFFVLTIRTKSRYLPIVKHLDDDDNEIPF